MNQDIVVIKKNGKSQKFYQEKVNNTLELASKGLNGISLDEIKYKISQQVYDKIYTEDLIKLMIKISADMISEFSPDYQYLAARLSIFKLRKSVFGSIKIKKLYDHIKDSVKFGYYDKEILDYYSKDEIEQIDNFIDHERDFLFSYAAIKQLEGKYLVQNRVTKEIFETPQFLYILISMVLFHKYIAKSDDEVVPPPSLL